MNNRFEMIKFMCMNDSKDKTQQEPTFEVPCVSQVEQFDDLCGYQVYDIDAYQTAAVKTMSDKTDLAVAALGLTGEAGEVADHVKKWLGHGHELDKDKMIKEIGDVTWYVAVLAHLLDVKLSDITTKNVLKLKKRYGDKFSVEASKNRKQGDD